MGVIYTPPHLSRLLDDSIDAFGEGVVQLREGGLSPGLH